MAAEVAQKLRDSGREERLVFMLQSYIVSLYLDCPVVRSSQSRQRAHPSAGQFGVAWRSDVQHVRDDDRVWD